MSRSYPIYNKVTACNYKSDKSWGSNKTSDIKTYVGSSASNSHFFSQTHITHRTHEDGTKEFRHYVDNVCIKRALLPKGATKLQIVNPNEGE